MEEIRIVEVISEIGRLMADGGGVVVRFRNGS